MTLDELVAFALSRGGEVRVEAVHPHLRAVLGPFGREVDRERESEDLRARWLRGERT